MFITFLWPGWAWRWGNSIPVQRKHCILLLKLFLKMPWITYLVTHSGLKTKPSEKGRLGIRARPGEGRRWLLCLGGLTECPRKGSRTKFSKGHLHHQSSNWVWLTLNVEFEVFSFSVNVCFKKVITYIYLQNGLPKPIPPLPPKGNWFLFSASHRIWRNLTKNSTEIMLSLKFKILWKILDSGEIKKCKHHSQRLSRPLELLEESNEKEERDSSKWNHL